MSQKRFVQCWNEDEICWDLIDKKTGRIVKSKYSKKPFKDIKIENKKGRNGTIRV